MPQTLSFCWCTFRLTSAAHNYMTRYHWVSRTSQLHTKASLPLLLVNQSQLHAKTVTKLQTRLCWENKDMTTIFLGIQTTMLACNKRYTSDISVTDCSQISTRLHQCRIQPSSTGIRSIPPSLMHIPEAEPASQLLLIIYSFLGRTATGP